GSPALTLGLFRLHCGFCAASTPPTSVRGNTQKFRRAAEFSHGDLPNSVSFELLASSQEIAYDVSRRRANVAMHQRTIQVEAWRATRAADRATPGIDLPVKFHQL